MTRPPEQIVPYNSAENKAVQVERMFDEIADNYDVLNHTLSMGIDRFWRKKGILSLQDIHPRKILDVAAGTGDLSLEACRRLHPDSILGIDISEKMMQIGRQKVARAGLSGKISFERMDSTALTLEDNMFDAAMIAFGIRNFEHPDKGLQEIRRVLKPGGKLMILELSSPERFPMKQLYTLYSKLVIPGTGRLVSKNKAAYHYLPKSISVFPQGKMMADILRKNGFREVKYTFYTFGICAMYLATK
ncbi:MAG: bifunctional demethylmenaquinone methyltransferase/2-methoxy-6-polyprenyl-1,4-benzoquinol methylase UbiE [Dysgonamonadaceae bacterium]|jgi:demethylmenaquinone methyltransferase/2-methoxy-6-polyprenyl-1,4-benzoquinol methylase|nr:bifunctional demethylmenaquinone methyltransferase/2-methoxy-6-polyprenyl-1,4-benzoquinol methylase UbiE [Dysgonamonadaceae bacterium]